MGSFELLTYPGDSITFDLYTLNMIESVLGGIFLLVFSLSHDMSAKMVILHCSCLLSGGSLATLEAAEDMQVAGCNNYI